MKAIFDYVTRKNAATALILLLVGVGLVEVLLGNMTLEALVALVAVPVTALVAGAGLSTISFTRAKAGEEVLGIAVVLVLLYAVVGAIQVITTHLSYEAYLHLIRFPAAGVAIGKGLHANNSSARK